MASLDDLLLKVERFQHHVDEAEAHVMRQELRISLLRLQGHNTAPAEQILSTLMKTRETMRRLLYLLLEHSFL